jgi:hypothetical protein
MTQQSALIFVAGVVFSCMANAAPEPLLGLPFGHALDRSISKCNAAESIATRKDYCALKDSINPAATPASALVEAPYPFASSLNIPPWISRKKPVDVRFNNAGAIVQIRAETMGPDQQDRIIESISGRLGKPTAFTTREVQNAYGAKWITPTVEWVGVEMVARFVCYSLTSCVLRFSTPDVDEEDQANMARQKTRDKL